MMSVLNSVFSGWPNLLFPHSDHQSHLQRLLLPVSCVSGEGEPEASFVQSTILLMSLGPSLPDS